ncbi:nucleoside transporter C-terminal domain-containing protein [Candidatus Albibeggiatoa sp. nov. BB20]|uniref:nucleoside transporter C-terminal domain-containing protein n=1 Tax=Candidatus Albibeggiatoa sp. nov. BB20 TaxID=3162723 RepID=UPI0033658B94
MGIPWVEGIKTILNEFITYIQLAWDEELSQCSRLIMIYALCGFANFGSLGIMIGGLGTLAPQRRIEIAELSY